jgi:hypothetical protein
MIEIVTELINSGLSGQEIADELSSYSKADLISAIRTYAEEFIHEDDVDGLLTRLEDLGNEVPGGRLETLLDKRMRREAKDGDYLVVQKELHEQTLVVPSEHADSKKEAARFAKGGGGMLYGIPDYDRMPRYFEYSVLEKGEGNPSYFDVNEV